MKTREEILANIKEWPNNIDDVNAPDGWSWSFPASASAPRLICNSHPDIYITIRDYREYILLQHIKHNTQCTCLPQESATAKQPDPKGEGDPILGMVLADLTNRALEGNKKYGEPLKAHNGRNGLWDAYQEALDLCMYLRQVIEEEGHGSK